MKTFKYILLLLLAALTLYACSSSSVSTGAGKATGTNYAIDELEISARAAIGRMETAFSGPMYTENDGRDIRLAILAPEAQGDVPAYLPLFIQGLLNNNFNKYSAISLIDRQYLDRIIVEQNIAANGRYSDQDFISIGNLTNAQYFLFGTIQRLSGGRYSLQLSITDSATGSTQCQLYDGRDSCGA